MLILVCIHLCQKKNIPTLNTKSFPLREQLISKVLPKMSTRDSVVAVESELLSDQQYGCRLENPGTIGNILSFQGILFYICTFHVHHLSETSARKCILSRLAHEILRQLLLVFFPHAHILIDDQN